MGKVINHKYIIIHHSLTKDNKAVSWEAIRKWHTGQHPDSPHKWKDIGYNYGIELIEKDFHILHGRSLLIPGAHTKGPRNKDSIGVCCVGDYDNNLVPIMLYEKLGFLLYDLINIFNIKIENVKGHRDYSNKSCPGNNFDLEYVRYLIHLKGR